MRRALIAVLLAGAAAGQEPAAPDREELEATLVTFKGAVDVKRPGDPDWVPAERNMTLGRGSEICTAMASTATVLFTGNLRVDLHPLSQARVEDLFRQGRAVRADVQLKFGAIEIDIEKGDLRADMKVATPHATTSVSGSRGIVRVSARRGAGRYVSLRTETGDWRIFFLQMGLEIPVRDAGVVGSGGEPGLDLFRLDTLDQMLHVLGRPYDEVYRSAGGDILQGGLLIHELYGPSGPAGPAYLRSASLPGPPAPPSDP